MGLIALLVALAAVGAGCGSETSAGEGATTGPSLAAAVEQALYDEGDTQEISCESLGSVEVDGVAQDVVRCAFSEEENGAGEMRSRGGCFTLENGIARDVTMDVPADVSCFT